MEELEHSKTESATPYKLQQARTKGLAARSVELSSLFVLAALTAYLWSRADDFGGRLAALSQRALAQGAGLAFGPFELWTWLIALASATAHAALPVFVLIIAAALASILLQVGFNFAPAALKPDFTRLNPANGFKRIFSKQALFESGKSVLKFAAYTLIACLVIREAALQGIQFAGEARGIASGLLAVTLELLFWMLAAMLVFAVIDLAFVRWQFGRKMMMSRRELREEHRQREGDPRIKQRRRQLQKELLSRSRSMRQLRGADLLITNPTHVAVGLKYEREKMLAPQVVSKGAGEFAQRLKRLAFLYGVPVFEEPALARALYFGVPLDQDIPEKHFVRTAAVYLRRHQARAAS